MKPRFSSWGMPYNRPSLTEAQLRKLRNDLDMLLGRPPHNVPSNHCYGDGYFANAMEREYGYPINELQAIDARRS